MPGVLPLSLRALYSLAIFLIHVGALFHHFALNASCVECREDSVEGTSGHRRYVYFLLHCCEPWVDLVESSVVLVGFVHFSWILARTSIY